DAMMRIFCQRTMLGLTLLLAAGARADGPWQYRDGGVVRGPADKKRIALEFTADEYVEGAGPVLDELARRRIKSSFFLTGRCLRNPSNAPLVRRILAEGHYLGP